MLASCLVTLSAQTSHLHAEEEDLTCLPVIHKRTRQIPIKDALDMDVLHLAPLSTRDKDAPVFTHGFRLNPSLGSLVLFNKSLQNKERCISFRYFEPRSQPQKLTSVFFQEWSEPMWGQVQVKSDCLKQLVPGHYLWSVSELWTAVIQAAHAANEHMEHMEPKLDKCKACRTHKKHKAH